MAKETFLKEIGGKSIVEQIVDTITNAIINGELKPGDKLPTENELCVSMGVGRNSVREAIKILAAYGVVTIRRAEGTFVEKKYDSKMLYPVLYGIILQENSMEQIMEMRQIIDMGILRLAIDKLDSNSLYKVEQAMKDLEGKVVSANTEVIELFEADINFHMALVDITQNALLQGICSYVNQITKKSRMKAIEKFLAEKEEQRFLLLHQKILQVLKEKDTKGINEVIENHYQYWEEVSC